ncbi:ADP-ribose pyrophosphatase [Thermosipho melanesiensis]|uniref:NUDIX hydrolase n=2 Tax=Thermosipho melanesiensis TaxID=46541 RepID=A6LKH1_THEM4|nr:NUDIX hydrolase [Thermosipho melanesiensis]ABR30422.1 NUDIX hydrolase [Thermosipho melanesiensis BI429]APT73582.1 ADP-ribose pyrophosphatase [Thermosipho melanesiensis]OOC37530.1 ADP-ribose pyrophosphatase [Thermosipho melanesiensis]OOC39426.1 ADP-ribose pyrophosphatase [Thermosipho melanesiensis]OOC39489.1 ADP-ribose pyrophosphatase [Thermosipho melanesiensis]
MEKLLESKEIFKGILLHVKKDEVLLENGKKSTREYVLHPGAVAVVPILDDNKIVMVKQYRYPVKKYLLEIPAGKFDFKGENPLECAKRELKEETGYEAKKFKYLGMIHTTPGFSDEVIHIYLAKNLVKGKSNPDEDEIIEVEIKDIDDVLEKCINGEITDAKTIVGIFKTYFHLRSE